MEKLSKEQWTLIYPYLNLSTVELPGKMQDSKLNLSFR